MKKIYNVLIFLLMIFTLFSCNSNSNKLSTSSNKINSQQSSEIMKNFTTVTMNNKTVVYDGNLHTIIVDGLPQFANVNYLNNGPYTNVGEYTINAIITAPGYNTLNLTATLRIIKADFDGLSFEDGTFEYDGLEKSISVSGNIPANATITYTSNIAGITNTAVEIGVYDINALIQAPNFNDLSLSAKLTIKTNDDKRYIKAINNSLYFQNALDNNKFYVYDFNNSNIQKISNDTAIEITKYASDSILYISKSLLNSSIKTVTYDKTTQEYINNSFLNKYANYIQVENKNTLYFVVNNITNNSSGIYKANLVDNDEPIITCLSVGKAKYLQLYNDKLYFADGNNNYKLSSISTNIENQDRTLVIDEKINNLLIHNGSLYFTINNILGDYIAKYTISTQTLRKLTIDSGIDFVIKGDYLYYVNIDKFTSNIIGKGIYRVNINPTIDNNNVGIKYIDGGSYGVCSLTSYDNNLIYYDLDGYKLIKYSLNNNITINLLDDFVKPKDPVPTSFGSQVAEANGIIYYLDIYDEKTLHSYNPKTKVNFRLTSEKVVNFSIIDDYIYFNMVTYGINNDTYRININISNAPELINTYDTDEIVSDGKYIYYVLKNSLGSATAIHKADLDGKNDIEIFEYAADNLILNNGNLYFCAKPNAVQTIMKIEDVANVKSLQKKICINDDYACDVFTIANNIIYFRHNYGFAYKFHKLAKMNIDGTSYTEIVSKNTDPTEILIDNEYIYYANSADTTNDFDLYKIALNKLDSTPIKLTNNKYVSSICKNENEIYFINYYLGGKLGDSNLYSVSIVDNTINQLTNN